MNCPPPPRRPGARSVLRRCAVPVAAAAVFTGCAVAILLLVRQQTGSEGLAVGLGLAVLPVPVVAGAFLWLGRTEPQPRRRLLLCFAWGAFASTLVALVANSWTTDLLVQRSGARGELVGSSTLVPLVEESAKGIVLLGLALAGRVRGPVSGLVLAGVTSCGFAFTENVLYLGRAFQSGSGMLAGMQLALGTLFVRAVLSPFAHPLFTCATGLGLGLAALCGRRRYAQVLLPLAGWVAAMALHGLWNAAAGSGMDGFLRMYAALMIPLFLAMLLGAVWVRGRELVSVSRHLAPYAGAGWLAPGEPAVLGSVRARRAALRVARGMHGRAGEAALREFMAAATELGRCARRGDAEFEQEQRLLHRLWIRRERAGAVLVRVAPPRRSAGGYGPR